MKSQNVAITRSAMGIDAQGIKIEFFLCCRYGKGS